MLVRQNSRKVHAYPNKCSLFHLIWIFMSSLQVPQLLRARRHSTRSRIDHSRRRIDLLPSCSPFTKEYINHLAARIVSGKCFRLCPRSAPKHVGHRTCRRFRCEYVTVLCATFATLSPVIMLVRINGHFVSDIVSPSNSLSLSLETERML